MLALVFFPGCVSKTSYDRLQGESSAFEAESEERAKKNASLEARIRDQTLLITDLQSRLGKVSIHKAELDRSLAETRQALNELAQRKAQIEKELSDFRNLTVGLKSMIDTGNVTVKFIKGRMVVSLGSDVLFTSGSAKLSPEGTEAVKMVTKQLVKIQKKEFQIEGHTDNVPIKTREFPSNWELASARALTVANTMMDIGMPADRVSAASYGDTHPTASNENAGTRSKNRRIDMVIVPDLSKLMDVDALDRQAKPKPETRKITSENAAAPEARKAKEELTDETSLKDKEVRGESEAIPSNPE